MQFCRLAWLISFVPLLRTITFSIEGVDSIALSTIFFNSSIFPRLTPSSAVIMTLDFESFMRSVNAWELNPEKTTIWMAPILLHASIAIGNSGTIGRYIVTRSPFLTPKLRKAFANLFTSM